MPTTLSSTNIVVFPTTRRTSAYSTRARLMSEMSLTGLINQLTDNDSFVISQSYSQSSAFKFNIHGYYFEVSANALTSFVTAIPASGTLYAHIELVDTADGYIELYGQDLDGAYTGLILNNTATYTPIGGGTAYNLALLSKDANSNVSIPSDSLIQFDMDRFNLDLVDGGEVS